MKKYGKVSYFKKVQAGWFLTDTLFIWKAFDNYGNCVAQARTKAECIKNARENGYSVSL